MEININGEATEIEEGEVSIARLLTLQEIESPDMVSVQLNGSIVDQENYGSTNIPQGAEVEFLYFMGGGSHFQEI